MAIGVAVATVVVAAMAVAMLLAMDRSTIEPATKLFGQGHSYVGEDDQRRLPSRQVSSRRFPSRQVPSRKEGTVQEGTLQESNGSIMPWPWSWLRPRLWR